MLTQNYHLRATLTDAEHGQRGAEYAHGRSCNHAGLTSRWQLDVRLEMRCHLLHGQVPQPLVLCGVLFLLRLQHLMDHAGRSISQCAVLYPSSDTDAFICKCRAECFPEQSNADKLIDFLGYAVFQNHIAPSNSNIHSHSLNQTSQKRSATESSSSELVQPQKNGTLLGYGHCE